MTTADEIDQLFMDAGSALYKVGLKGRHGKPRSAQADYARSVQTLLERPDGIGFFQGETGSGKTIGYLTPALLQAARTGQRVIVSTCTLGLQKQVFEETLPMLLDVVATIAGKRLTAARRIGRRNFISLPALEALSADLAQNKTDPALVTLMRKIVRRMKARPLDATQQFLSEHYGQQLAELRAPSHWFESLDIGQYEGDEAAYIAMVDEAAHADVVVINHALLATELMRVSNTLVENDRQRPIVIVDEADALPAIVAQMVSRKLPVNEIRSMARSVKADDATIAKMFRDIGKLDKLFEELEHDTHVVRPRRDAAAILPLRGPASDISMRAMKLLAPIEKTVSEWLDTAQLVKARKEDLRNLLADLTGIRANLQSVARGGAPQETASLYWSPVRGFPGFHLDGGQPGMMISRLWRLDTLRPATLLFTSATLTGGSDRERMVDFAREIGMSNEIYLQTTRANFAPDHFGKMEFVVIDQRHAPTVTIPNSTETDDSVVISNPAIIEWWCGMVKEAAACGGRVLVLTSSYRDARAIHMALGRVGRRMVLIESKGDGAATLQAFRDTPDAILISPARWEGLDMPGIRHIVIPRFPLSPPDVVRDAIRETHRIALGVSQKKLMRERFPASMAAAQRKFLQGVGRGIRSETDITTVWIGDSRWPLPPDRQEKYPHIKTPAWAAGAQGAVPARFRRNLDAARAFRLGFGVSEFDAATPTMTRRVGRAPTSRIHAT